MNAFAVNKTTSSTVSKIFLSQEKTGIIFENKRANLIHVPTNNDLGGAFLVLTDDVPKKSHLPLIKHHSNYL